MRIEKVWKAVEHECDAFLVECPVNLFYLTGKQLSAGKLLIKGPEAYLIVDNRYYETCKNDCALAVLPSEKTELKTLLAAVTCLGFDSESTSYQSYKTLETHLNGLNCQLVPLQNPVAKVRVIKDVSELKLLKEAAQFSYQGYEYAKSLLHNGISEIEVANELEIYWKKNGSQGLSFEPIIAFGSNGSMPHYRAADMKLEDNMTVLMDIGVKKNGYHSDMTRTFFHGKPSEKMQEIYDIVQEAQYRALAICKPGTLVGELDDAARNYIASKCYGEQFLHSLGHGIGLEVHEWPLIRNRVPYAQVPLEAGMVLTIEPGIYLPSIGGVRIEDTIAITNKGYENLTY